uniref:Uncharacterized protein n=1 Tax=Salarias fasciatus TaxID=181472 RepID=A0A672HYC9_SALFA
MPIWSMTCCQLWVEPFFLSPATSCSLILMIRFAIPWTSSNLGQTKSGVLRMVEAILPPTRSPGDIHRSPMFLAKDWESTMLWPCSMKWRTAQASRSMSPLAKP